MSYTVIARKWRPQKFDDVVGQQAVTRTLRNALASGRLAQSFVFAGPRGVGKTTTARILARMLNCVKGPTADPCGDCDACREIADGRDMDVLEIAAATNTQVEKIRDVIIAGLGVTPARDRYKIFIIDEVHQLSGSSFNALLKSIEEPPPHVAFIMATTLVDKIPDTIISRSQVFEFKTIASKSIAEQLKKIAEDPKDPIAASPEAIALIARSAEGSMRDAETAFDQVIAFSGKTITVEDVATVLGLVGRDLLFDIIQAVADENGAAAFELAGRAVEAGYDLRLLCRELARLVRDLLVLSVDPSRFTDPDIVPEVDRERLTALLPRFSREDLLRSFDVLTRAESEIRGAAEPRYHLEMALLRWIHLRKLLPIEQLIERLDSGTPLAGPGPARASMPASAQPSRAPAPAPTSSSASVARRLQSSSPPAPPARPAAAVPAGRPSAAPAPIAAPFGGDGLKDRFLAAVQKAKTVLYNTSIAEAIGVDVEGDRVRFRFGSSHTMAAERLGREKALLEALALETAGRKMTVTIEIVEGGAGGGAGRKAAAAGASSSAATAAELKEKAKQDPAVQALLDVFPGEVRDAKELKDP